MRTQLTAGWAAVKARSGHGAKQILTPASLMLAMIFGLANISTGVVTGATWTATGSMVNPRYGHSATLLANGKVLVARGSGLSGYLGAELYDPATGAWTATGPMINGSDFHTATLLPNGKVLVAGV